MAELLITGATGKVGNALLDAAVKAGHSVRVLARNRTYANALLSAEVEIVDGDLSDPASLAVACAGRELVFNAAGLPQQWLAGEAAFDHPSVC